MTLVYVSIEGKKKRCIFTSIWHVLNYQNPMEFWSENLSSEKDKSIANEIEETSADAKAKVNDIIGNKQPENKHSWSSNSLKSYILNHLKQVHFGLNTY